MLPNTMYGAMRSVFVASNPSTSGLVFSRETKDHCSTQFHEIIICFVESPEKLIDLIVLVAFPRHRWRAAALVSGLCGLVAFMRVDVARVDHVADLWPVHGRKRSAKVCSGLGGLFPYPQATAHPFFSLAKEALA